MISTLVRHACALNKANNLSCIFGGSGIYKMKIEATLLIFSNQTETELLKYCDIAI